jgi:hypothetical protein
MRYGELSTDIDLEQFLDEYSYLFKGGYALDYAGSGQAPEPFEVESLEAFSAWRGDYAEEDVQALLRLKDGRYATLSASCDTSGYDCIGSVDWRYAETFEEAVLFGLDENARRVLFPEEKTTDES